MRKTDKHYMTRVQALELCGADAMDRVEGASPTFSHRVLDGTVQFSASVPCGDDTLTAYYYQDSSAVDAAETLDELNWTIFHYSLD